ncbi:MAG: DUF3572 domain-containing protein [Gemmobacter sp.]
MNRQETAETLALQVLAWLVGQPDTLGAFLTLTGASAADLACGARDPAFLGAVMDFVLAEDARVIDCAAALDCPPMRIAEARAGLPGGDLPHWT